jgi:membrane protease YdiL (CAAX protease family)
VFGAGDLIDAALTFTLVAAIPGYQLFKTLGNSRNRPANRTRTYLSSIVLALTLDTVVAAHWIFSARPARSLGLAGLSNLGWIGVALVSGLLACALVYEVVRPIKPASASEVEAEALLPGNASEAVLFVLFGAVIGISWELLYRGFLLWQLTPAIGTVGAIVVAATAYGAAHGYKNSRQFAMSLLAACVLTVAYALSGSLWWLMILHAGLPMMLPFLLAYKRHRRRAVFANIEPSAVNPL